MRIVSIVVATTICSLASFTTVASPPPGASPDLDIGALIGEGREIAKREGDAERSVAELDALMKKKQQSEVAMTAWRPKVESYEADCGKGHVWNSNDPQQLATAHQCQDRLGALNPPYSLDKKAMLAIDAELAARGIDQDHLGDWRARLASERQSALDEHNGANDQFKMWKVRLKVAGLLGPMTECLKQASAVSLTNEALVDVINACWEGSRHPPALTIVNRGTNAFGAVPVQPGDTKSAAPRKRGLDDVEVPPPDVPKAIPCSIYQWLTERTGVCEHRRRGRRNATLTARG